jgi:hypothetical protein
MFASSKRSDARAENNSKNSADAETTKVRNERKNESEKRQKQLDAEFYQQKRKQHYFKNHRNAPLLGC